jgi:ABC-type transport system substrate-binding protein
MPKRRRPGRGVTPTTTAGGGRDGRRRPPPGGSRAISRAALMLGIALCAAGCAPETEVPVAERRPTAAAEVLPEPPAASDTVVIAVRRLPATLDPTGELDPWGQRVVDDLLFEGLTRRLPDAPWAEPALAERCVVQHEGRNVACKLRPGARFHDGEAVSIDDLLYSINLWVGNRGINLRNRYAMDEIKSVESGPPPGESGEGWVRIAFSQRDPLVLERIAAMKIVPRARHGAGGRFARQPIGSGPMQLVSQAEDRLVFARSATGPGLARQIELRAMDDGAAALTALRRGEIHLLAEVAPVHIPRELGKPGMSARFEAFLLSPPRYDMIIYNLREGPQAGPRLRSALDAAIPRAEIATAVQGVPGFAVAAPVDLSGPTPIDLVAIAEERVGEAGLGPFLKAPEAAADVAGRAAADLLLAELGWILDRGQRRRGTAALRLPLSWDGSAGLATGTARALRAAWKQIGVQAPSVTASWPFLLGLLRVGKFSMALARLAGPSDMDLSPWFHSRGAHNLSGIADGELDRALDAYRHASSRSERDASKAAISARLAALHPVSVLFAPVQVLLASRALTGLGFIDDLPRLDRLGLQRAPEALLHGGGG